MGNFEVKQAVPSPSGKISASMLAKAVGVSAPAVTKWLRRPDWPFGPAPWGADIIPQVVAWRANLQEDRAARPQFTPLTDPAPEAPKVNPPPSKVNHPTADVLGKLAVKEKFLKLQHLEAKLRRLEADYQQFQELYVKKSDVEAAAVRKALAVRNELMNTARLLAALEPYLQPGTNANADEAIKQWARGVCDRFAGNAGDDLPANPPSDPIHPQ